MAHLTLHAPHASSATRALVTVLAVATALAPLPVEAFMPQRTTTPTRAVQAAPSRPPAPPQVRVNRTVPKVERPALRPTFSRVPTAQEIKRAPMFSLPLVPVGATSENDNQTLAQALVRFSNRSSRADWQSLDDFLAAHPTSPWRPALVANLADMWARDGAYSRAMALYTQVWQQTRGLETPDGRALADFALGEWFELAIKFGQIAAVKARLTEMGARDVQGTAATKVAHAKEGVWFLENLHHMAVFSGPEALKALLQKHRGDNTPVPAAVKDYMPTMVGTSLKDLERLSAASDYPLRPVFRAAGPIPVPSIVHLRVDHYTAVIARENGGYVIRDPILGGQRWVRAEILEAETSGFALVEADTTLPAAGRAATEAEAMTVVGHCAPGMPAGEEPCPCNGAGGGGGSGGGGGPGGSGGPPTTSGPPPNKAMPGYVFHPLKAAVLLSDTPLGYAPPRGPRVSFTLRYDHRDQRQPQVFNYGNVGPRWTFDWLSYVSDNFSSAYPPYTWTRVYLQGQGGEWYGAQDYSPLHWRSRAELVKVSNDPVRYERRLPDGTVEVFDVPDRGPAEYGRRIFLTQIIDPQGLTLSFTYDAQLRLVAVTDAIGQVTTLAYAHPSDPLKLTSISDPFGRTATLAYNGNGQLASVTDVIGLTSTFSYGTEDFINALTTPYGTTSFRRGEVGPEHGTRWVEATDPVGGTERLEFRFQTNDLPATVAAGDVPSGFAWQNVDMNRYLSLYWDQRAMSTAPGQVASAVQTHWLMSEEMNYSAFVFSRNIPHSIKKPLESRVWYRYPGQSSARARGTGTTPTHTARVLDHGSTQLWQQTLNTQGMTTERIDPLGRRTSYDYAANGIDLLEVRQTTGSLNDLLATFGSYTAGHLPQTLTNAAGQSVTLTSNAAGQLVTVTNALSQTTTYAYDTDGRLQSLTLPMTGAVTSYAYDAYDRVRTVTRPDGHAVTLDYDALDRPTRTTYPDGTYEETVYARLDPVQTRDRLGRWTYRTYDAQRRLTSTRDPAGRIIRYEWCGCGGLDALIDGKGQRTSWGRDAQGRVISEVRADAATTTTYTYDLIGRLKTVTDPRLQVTTYTYAADNATLGLAFTNAQIATPSVTYTYDPNYGRMATMLDGIGTTSYTYHAAGTLGANQVATVDGPLTDDTIAYTYDVLGRVTQRTIDGIANSLNYVYDTLGRVTTETNVLGSFTYSYDGVTSRLASVLYPHGQTSSYGYLPVLGDHRLQTIHHRYAGGTSLSKFDYTYDAGGNILTWQKQADSDPAIVWEYGYDPAGQLTRAVKKSTGGSPAVLQRYTWGYDPAGNRLYEQLDDAVTGWTYDSLNRLVTQYGGGTLRFAGTVNEPATVSVAGQAAAVSPTGAFERGTPVIAGANVVSVQATDAAGNMATADYQLVVGAATQTFTFDANGNLTSDGTRLFEWDARNQLVAVSIGSHRTEFVYDGLRRRVREIEKEQAVTQSDTWMLWCEAAVCEERAAGGQVVTRRSFGLGEQLAGASRFFSRDHLGSVHDVTSAAGTLEARYAFDPWGRRTVETGAGSTAAGFTGHRTHARSGLTLTRYRGYDPEIGRWISDDPLGFVDGVNAQLYASNGPIAAIDPNGLASINLVVRNPQRHHEYKDLTDACNTSVSQGVTHGCMRVTVYPGCSCVEAGCNQWRALTTLDVILTPNIMANDNAKPHPDRVLAAEANHAWYALSALDQAAAAAAALERQRFRFKATCQAACAAWVVQTLYTFWNDPTHSTNPHRY